MCTLTYIPIGENHCIITSNRDESKNRVSALYPKVYVTHGKKLLYPKDPVGGGSWIATSENGLTACLLNGAFQPHIPKPGYRKSRGLIVLELFEFENMFHFSKEIDLIGIEPFTLIMIDKKNVLEMKWIGGTKHLKFYDSANPHLWASEQLYSHENIIKRKNWFKQFLDGGKFSRKDIIHFHETAGDVDKENNMKMERENTVSTISITSLEIDGKDQQMYYKDLPMNKETYIKLNLY